jgi:site-specific recombinase XerD
VSEVVALENNHIIFSGDVVSVFIKTSKTDQSGSGAAVQVKKSNEAMLLFQSLQKFSVLSAHVSRASYFCHLNSKPLTQYQFSSMLRKALQFLNIESSQFKSHSFRIGGATHLYMKLGFSEETI